MSSIIHSDSSFSCDFICCRKENTRIVSQPLNFNNFILSICTLNRRLPRRHQHRHPRSPPRCSCPPLSRRRRTRRDTAHTTAVTTAVVMAMEVMVTLHPLHRHLHPERWRQRRPRRRRRRAQSSPSCSGRWRDARPSPRTACEGVFPPVRLLPRNCLAY